MLTKTQKGLEGSIKSPEPTAVGAGRFAIAVHVASRRWLLFSLGHMSAMRLSFILFAGSLVIVSGCCTSPHWSDQQAFDSSLTEAQIFMKTLQALDSGDIAKARRVSFTPVCVDLSTLPYYARVGHPTAEMVALAKEVLDYMLVHRQEFDGRLPSIQACVHGLRKILTEPEDVRRIDELSDYLGIQKP